MSDNATIKSGDEDVVNLPVPKKYLTAVIQALARIIEADAKGSAMQEAISSSTTVPWPIPKEEAEEITIVWDREKLSSIRAKLKNKAILTLLDMAADKPGERVYVQDVMDKLGCSHGQVGAGLGVLTKTINKAFNLRNKRYNWPAPFAWDSGKQLAYYIMEPEVASAWKASAKP